MDCFNFTVLGFRVGLLIIIMEKSIMTKFEGRQEGAQGWFGAKIERLKP